MTSIIEVHRWKLTMVDEDFSGTVSYHKDLEEAKKLGQAWGDKNPTNIWYVDDHYSGEGVAGSHSQAVSKIHYSGVQ